MAKLYYDGKSEIDGKEILVLVTEGSANPKTGNVYTTWILAKKSNPLTAYKNGDQKSVCGDCPMIKGCYVEKHYAPLGTYRQWERGKMQRITADELKTKQKRHGGFGNPSAVPYETVAAMWNEYDFGYVHDWRTCDQRFKHMFMASCETDSDEREALALGWRVYRIMPRDTKRKTGVECPHDAMKAKGKPPITCAQCRLCNGHATKHGNKAQVIWTRVKGKIGAANHRAIEANTNEG